MNIKTVVKRAAAIFEPQTGVVRADDVNLPIAVTAVTEPQPQEPGPTTADPLPSEPRAFDLSALRNSGKKAAPPVVAAPVFTDTADPPAPAPTPATAAEIPAEPVPASTVAAMTPELVKTLAPIIEKIVRQLLQQQVQSQVEKSTEETPAAAEPALQGGEIPGSSVPLYVAPVTYEVDPASGLDTSETPEQIQARLDADLARAVRAKMERGRGANPQANIVNTRMTSNVHEYRRR
jgi:hypothetical protein